MQRRIKQRLTITFFVTAAGEKEQPIVIWKYENLRCLNRFDKSCLPVTYFSQGKAWMTNTIMDSILKTMNRKMLSQKCHILLFMDNAGCHPEELCASGRYSNIKVCFLPPNTMSVLQPLDLGIINTFKIHYRRYFLKYVTSKIDECERASDVAKS